MPTGASLYGPAELKTHLSIASAAAATPRWLALRSFTPMLWNWSSLSIGPLWHATHWPLRMNVLRPR
jgi:hypothetical protein